MIPFHSLHVTPKQDYLHSIHFHFFSFLYSKTSNQGYLIPFHSILFHSFPLLKYISFIFIHFHSLMIIPFYFIPLWTPKRSLKLPNKEMDFPSPLLKLPNKRRKEYSKIILTPYTSQAIIFMERSSRQGCAAVISHKSGIKTFFKWSPIINALSAPADWT